MPSWQSALQLCDSTEAAQMPTAEALMYVHDVMGLPWDAKASSAAAAANSIDCLSYARASGCRWSLTTCVVAANNGSLDCLAYAHEHGCEWNTMVLHDAAQNGHLDCLKYAHTHGCPHNSGLPLSFLWTIRPYYLTTQAVIASSMPCLVYVHEVMECVWDPEGSECKTAFELGDLEILQYIHSHGGVLCTQFDVLCPDKDFWLDPSEIDAERNAACLLYMLSYGGCQVKGIWDTEVGSLVLETIKARRMAVLLSFHAAGKAVIESPIIAAAHAAMQTMPSHIVQKIICTAGLQVAE